MSRRIQPLSLLLLCLDLAIVPTGLGIASWLRSVLPFGRGGALDEAAVSLPWLMYLLGAFCWVVCLFVREAYSPQAILRWYNEAFRVIYGSMLATFVMAGVLYQGFREMSRLQGKGAF